MAEDVFGIVGSVVAGAYQVEKVVAEGGFAVVYRAHHAGFRAPIALKCLKIPQHLGSKREAEFLEQFRGEAELLFHLSASITNIVRPLHVDAMTVPDGSFVPFMALEWLEGETLEQIVRRRQTDGRSPLTLKKLIRLLEPVGRALERAHNFQGPDGAISIVHRDLKPENIFLARVAGEEVPKILDFGIGKAKSVASQVAGRSSAPRGEEVTASFTPAYGAPEQWLPKRYGQTGPWTDVWGLALTMVETMVARPLIDGDHAAMMGTVLDETRRPTPRTEGLEVSDEVEAVFARALALDPRVRYPDAGLFWNELLEAAGMSSDKLGGRRRDLRVDGSAPREEQIEAVMPRTSRPAPVLAARTAETVAAEAAPPSSAAPMDPFGTPLPVRPSRPDLRAVRPAAIEGVDLQPTPAAAPQIPDLVLAGAPAGAAPASLAAAAATPPASASPPTAETEPAAEESAPESIDHGNPSTDGLYGGAQFQAPAETNAPGIELDLAPGERPEQRMSSPDLDAAGGALRTSTTPATHSQRPNGRGVATKARSLPSFRPPASVKAQSPIQIYVVPGALVIAGIVLTVASQIYASSTGEVFALGPLTAGMFAGPLVLAGIGLAIWRTLQSS